MKYKFLLIVAVILLLLSSSVFGYETDSYIVDSTNFNLIDGIFYDKDDDSSFVVIDTPKVSLGSYFTYENTYTSEMLNSLNDNLLEVLQNTVPNAEITSKLKANFSSYPCFIYYGKMDAIENYPYYFKYYIFFSDNYRHEISFFSYDKNYFNSKVVTDFINSYNVKDTLKIDTPAAKKEATTVPIASSNNEYKPFYADYTLKDWVTNIILAIFIYLFVPIIIRFVLKKSFKSGTAFWVSLGNFIFMKFLWAFLFNTLDTLVESSSLTAGWWYIFIAQAILTKKEKKESNIIENNISDETQIEDEPLPEELINIISDKERIKQILCGNEKIDESLFIGIESPFNNKKIETKEDIVEYLSNFLTLSN